MGKVAVIKDNTIITIVDNTPMAAAKDADRERGISPRDFMVFNEDRSPLVEYSIYELDKFDYEHVKDVDRHADTKYVGYVRNNCKRVALFAVKWSTTITL